MCTAKNQALKATVKIKTAVNLVTKPMAKKTPHPPVYGHKKIITKTSTQNS